MEKSRVVMLGADVFPGTGVDARDRINVLAWRTS
jgi:hypothetical protein